MNGPLLIADIDALVAKRVLAFVAVNDMRYYLCGLHLTVGVKAKGVLPRVEATNGHILYAEEDRSAVISKDVIIRIGKGGRTFLKANNRVKVYADRSLRITDGSGAPVYVEPEQGTIEGKFPIIHHLVGAADKWHEGLRAPLNTRYLQQAINLPGAIRFFSRKDDNGKFSTTSAVMFVMDGGTANGGKAMGLIMPLRSQFEDNADVASMIPASLLVQGGAA